MIDTINGKILIFSDQHFGLKGNSETKLKIAIQAFKEVIAYVKANKIEYVISCGDIFHSRTQIDVNVMNVAYRCISALAKHCKVLLICGNHDAYMKNTISVNSINIFQDIDNVILIDKVTQISINSKSALLVPWLGDVSSYGNEMFDLMFGHFEISSKYLIKSYVEEHKNSSEYRSSESKTSSNDLVGNFIDVLKKDGIVFAGHIHTRKEFISKGRNFIFIGSPYQQNLGEKDNRCGFYILDEKCKYQFIEIENVPKHVDIRMSDLKDNIDKYDFSVVKGNIVHKIYDVEIDQCLDSKISQKIQDYEPFEEILPDYEVQVSDNKSNVVLNESIEILKKSKLEYIQNYINEIDQKVLDDLNINKDSLYLILEEYYNLIA